MSSSNLSSIANLLLLSSAESVLLPDPIFCPLVHQACFQAALRHKHSAAVMMGHAHSAPQPRKTFAPVRARRHRGSRQPCAQKKDFHVEIFARAGDTSPHKSCPFARNRMIALQVSPGSPASRSSCVGQRGAHPHRDNQNTTVRGTGCLGKATIRSLFTRVPQTACRTVPRQIPPCAQSRSC
jgi:hypothetical protein